MKKTQFLPIILVILFGCNRSNDIQKPPTVRVAVIGGMMITGMWNAVAKEFEKKTGIPVEVVAAGPKEILNDAFRKGGVDLLTMHSSDVASNLVADGYGINMHPWARNELVIMGPASDPAGINGMKSGMEALLKIASVKAPFVEARNTGSQTIEIHLWRMAKFTPQGSWLLKDESSSPQQVVDFAASRGAYVIVGRIPILYGKMTRSGMQIMVEGDPEMRRPYVVMEANPLKNLGANPEGAHLLSQFLSSPAGQTALQVFAANAEKGLPIFYPITPSTQVGAQ